MPKLPTELLAKYTTFGPRYTSYPPASSFLPQVDPKRVKEIWRESSRLQGADLSLYLHIPFCRGRCLYCGCHTTSEWTEETLQEYTEALLREIELAAPLLGENRKVRQIAFGGGTPNILDKQKMRAILRKLTSNFEIQEGAEQSIELDPRILDLEYIDFLVEVGFNRFSLGVQDLDPIVQKNIGRVQGEEKIATCVHKMRATGIDAINFDLIYGLPGQTLQSFEETIEKVIHLAPSRIAVFGYAHVPWIHPHQKRLEEKGLPDTEMRGRLVEMSTEKLTSRGYVHIGLDHFAREDDELTIALRRRNLHRNFMGYTTQKGLRLAAFGSSAISAIGPTYVQNDKDLVGYLRAIRQESRMPWKRGFILSRDDEIRRDLIMELFCNLYVDLETLGERYEVEASTYFAPEMERVSEMEKDGLLVIRRKVPAHGEAGAGASEAPVIIELTPLGRHFVRNICMVFDRYLEPEPGKRIHSKTI